MSVTITISILMQLQTYFDTSSLLLLYLDFDCGHPGDIDNGNVTFTRTTIGAGATYSCKDGYELQPPGSIRICDRYGNWSGEVPTCVGE